MSWKCPHCKNQEWKDTDDYCYECGLPRELYAALQFACDEWFKYEKARIESHCGPKQNEDKLIENLKNSIDRVRHGQVPVGRCCECGALLFKERKTNEKG